MELGFDHHDLLGTADSAKADARSYPGEAPAPEWAGLKARFLAAHGLRRELAEGAQAGSTGGSFTAASADVLASGRKISPGVNPTTLANGKALFGIEAIVDGNPHAEDRGPTPKTKECHD